MFKTIEKEWNNAFVCWNKSPETSKLAKRKSIVNTKITCYTVLGYKYYVVRVSYHKYYNVYHTASAGVIVICLKYIYDNFIRSICTSYILRSYKNQSKYINNKRNDEEKMHE